MIGTAKLKLFLQGVYLATETTKGRSSRKQAIQEELFQKQMGKCQSCLLYPFSFIFMSFSVKFTCNHKFVD